LPAYLTNAAAFSFDGQGGTDTANVRNASGADGFTYTATPTSLQTSRNFPASSYSWFASEASVEQMTIFAGPTTDITNIVSLASGQTLDFHGAGGDDSLNLPPNSSSLAGRINFFGEAGTTNRINE